MTNNKTEGVEDRIMRVLIEYEQSASRSVGRGCNFDKYIIPEDYQRIVTDIANQLFPSPPPGVEQRAKEIETVETFDLSQLPHEEKLRMINELTMEIIKPYLGLFLSIGLKTHIEQMVIEQNTGQEYIFSFRTLPEHMKKRKEEQESIAGSESQGQEAGDWKAKYEKCIQVIKRFDPGIIGMYDL